ncbi:MAG: hypothetical protein IRZ06_12200 [Nevskia sp.]|nr:hypothetical protein [Nevskia sp.]
MISVVTDPDERLRVLAAAAANGSTVGDVETIGVALAHAGEHVVVLRESGDLVLRFESAEAAEWAYAELTETVATALIGALTEALGGGR